MKKDFKKFRKYIENIDSQLLNLISKRAICAKKVANLSKDPKKKIVSHERENQFLKNIRKYNKGPFSNKEISRLFRKIRSACLSLEIPIQVVYMGPEGTFTQQAVIKHFGKSVRSVPVKDVFNTIENKKYKYEYGVVPVENSTEGIVNNTLDSFINSKLKICGEVILSIHHHFLIGKKNITKKIEKIYSHQQSFSQCQNWLNINYPYAKRIAVSSNAEASKLIKYESNSAAIAGDIAASYYSLNIIAQNIEDRINNYTRFLILSDKDVPPTGYDKTLLMISIQNQIGSLYLIIEPFYRYNIDILRFTTRPAPPNKAIWNYIFFIEIKGHRKSKLVEKILEEISMRGAEIKILGSYPNNN